MSIFKILTAFIFSTVGLTAIYAQPSFANDHGSKIINDHGAVLSEHDKYPEADDYDSESVNDTDNYEQEDDDYDPGEHNPFPGEFNYEDDNHDAK
jgi:hypothetical protein